MKTLLKILLFIVLTILTQVGGLVYLLSLSTYPYLNRKFKQRLLRGVAKSGAFLAIYTLSVFVLVPVVAKPLGRVALPVWETGKLKPLNMLSCLLNRHYVRPALKETAAEVALEMHRKYPGSTVQYLDAGFPFLDGFPLFPHLSHNDGKKLDLSFYYKEASTGKPTNSSPSLIGYGISEDLLPGEENMAEYCKQKGYWQYSFLTAIVPQTNKTRFSFDPERTKALVELFAASPAVGKIFIEPHLKERLGLSSNKIRFHGCQAVRHDDHLHLQIL